MVWCNTTRTDTIDFGILGHTTNNGSEQPYETLSKIIRHDQVLVVWNAPVPTTGRFPGSQLNTHKIAFPVSKNQWLPCPSGMRIIQCSLLTVTRSRRSSTCFPFTLSPHFAVPGTDCPIFDMHPSYHPPGEKAMKRAFFFYSASFRIYGITIIAATVSDTISATGVAHATPRMPNR